MKHYFISGIQQVGIGTTDFRKSWNWYIEHFGTDIRILEDDTVAERMLPYTGNQPQKRHACIAVNLQGGGGFEIWQYSERMPVPPTFEIAVGDCGIFAAKLKCRNVEKFHSEMLKKKVECSPVGSLPNGIPCFYLKDLYGNFFQIIENQSIYIEQNKLTGGIAGTMIGVTDMEKSIRFYKDILGYKEIVYDKTGTFHDWLLLPGGTEKYRRVLLAYPEIPKGPFAQLLDYGQIELVQPLERSPRKIYEGRFWGDPGFIQICYDVTNMKALGEFCKKEGFPFTVDSCPDDKPFDMGDAQGHFTYIEDPDETLIEFVETHKIPIAKKLGLFLDLQKRNRTKPLPKWLFRLMSCFAKEKIR